MYICYMSFTMTMPQSMMMTPPTFCMDKGLGSTPKSPKWSTTRPPMTRKR